MSTRVLVVDDSALSRRWLLGALETDRSFVVAGTATNGVEAVSAALELRPDLITLDLNMPVMDGASALKRVMATRPCRTVVVSHMALAESRLAFDCLRYGAVDFMVKPSGLDDSSTERHARAITLRLRRAAAVAPSWLRLRRLRRHLVAPTPDPRERATRLVIAVAEQSGMADVLQSVSVVPRCSGLAFLALLDVSSTLTTAFASYSAEYSMLGIQPWQTDTLLLGGGAYFCSSGESILPTREGANCVLKGFRAPLGSGKDSLAAAVVTSAAECFGEGLDVVLLSGTCPGGSNTLGALHRAGARVWCQDSGPLCDRESVRKIESWPDWATTLSRRSL